MKMDIWLMNSLEKFFCMLYSFSERKTIYTGKKSDICFYLKTKSRGISENMLPDI